MSDTEKSMSLAQKLHCHKYIIQHHINHQDRLALISYMAKIGPEQEEYFLIENALQSPVSKSTTLNNQVVLVIITLLELNLT